MNDTLYTVIGMLGTSLISLLLTLLVNRQSFKYEIKKFNLTSKNTIVLNMIAEKRSLYFEYLRKTPNAFYMRDETNFNEYLSVYRRFNLICPDNCKDLSNKVHGIIVNTCENRRVINVELENALSELSVLLRDDLKRGTYSTYE